MAEYSFKDIITGKDIITDQVKDSDIIGAEGYFTNDLQDIVDSLDYDSSLDALPKGTLETVTYSGRFKKKEDKEYYEYFILKKESVKKYVPFDLSKEEDRARLRGAWLRLKEHSNEEMVKAIYPFIGRVSIDNEEVITEFLLENYEFVDGTPCGKLVEE